MNVGPIRAKVLVVDDERPILMTLQALLERHGYQVLLANSAGGGLGLLDEAKPDIVLLDIGLPDANGLEVLATIKQRSPLVQVIILSAQDSLSNAIQAIKLGAFHFISKPYAPEELMSLIGRAIEQSDLVRETADLRAQTEVLTARLKKAEDALKPVFKSRRMKEVEDLLGRVAPSEANVLFTGESGVGKEVMANRVHALSRRANGPIVKLNCAAFPPNMIESELFGYMKGAFTGAVSDFKGMIAEASGGTLFLDEIAEMPAELQTRFLRVLQEREFRPLGSTKTVKADFRLVAATNRHIPDALQDGTLRHDLYYRINTFHIEIPPLRDRREDIAALVHAFVHRFAAQSEKAVPVITPEAMEMLVHYSWPGNVRELQNAIEYGVVLCRQNQISEKELPSGVTLPPALQGQLAGAPTGHSHSPGPKNHHSDALNLENREREAIIKALAQSHGNKKRAAEILGIHRPTLYAKIKRYAIQL